MTNNRDPQQVYQQIIEAVASNDAKALDGLIAADMVDHNPVPGQGSGLDGIKTWMAGLHASFTGLSGFVEDTVVEGGKLAGRVTWSGTQVADYAGRSGAGSPGSISAMHIMYFRDGMATDWWGIADLSGLG